MMTNLLLVILAVGLLFVGADSLVRGAASLADRLGLSALAIGLTVVAFGTSAPEVLVSVDAALGGRGDIAAGNVVGSNIFNIAMILGLTAVITPVAVASRLVKIDVPVMLLVSMGAAALMLDGTLGRLESGLLFAGIVVYTAFNFLLARGENVEVDALAAGFPVRGSLWRDGVAVVVGLVLLVFGAHLLVENAAELARLWGLSEAVIGLTIVAAGTSVPELATSVVAAVRRQADIAIGNVVGSNVFNLLCILGVAGLVRPLEFPALSRVDLVVMLLVAAALLPMIHTARTIQRSEGWVLLALFVGYMAWLLVWA